MIMNLITTSIIIIFNLIRYRIYCSVTIRLIIFLLLVQVPIKYRWNGCCLSFPLSSGGKFSCAETGLAILRTFLQRSKAWRTLHSSET